jgi:hypothetical protein
MTQALVSRILVPGMSNFVNASVWRSLRPLFESLRRACLTHPQILHSVASVAGMPIFDDEELTAPVKEPGATSRT